MVQWKLFWAQCEEGSSIEEHIRTMQGYQQELHILGQKLSDEDFSMTILTSFSES